MRYDVSKNASMVHTYNPSFDFAMIEISISLIYIGLVVILSTVDWWWRIE